jgi:hypothetical protein
MTYADYVFYKAKLRDALRRWWCGWVHRRRYLRSTNSAGSVQCSKCRLWYVTGTR